MPKHDGLMDGDPTDVTGADLERIRPRRLTIYLPRELDDEVRIEGIKLGFRGKGSLSLFFAEAVRAYLNAARAARVKGITQHKEVSNLISASVRWKLGQTHTPDE